MNKNNIGKLMLQLRLAKNLSQQELSADICTQSFLSRIEAGGTEASFSKMHQLLQRIGLSMSEFEYMLLSQDESYQQNDEILQQYLSLNFHTLDKLHPSSTFPYINEMHACFNSTFRTQFTLTEEPDCSYITDMLLQDEFLNADYAPIIFAMPVLPLEAAEYTRKRLHDQIKMHQIRVSYPHLQLLANLVLSAVYLSYGQEQEALEVLNETLRLSRSQGNVNYLIVTQLMLYRLTSQKIYQKEAFQINELFSKDNFYEYWYNTLIE